MKTMLSDACKEYNNPGHNSLASLHSLSSLNLFSPTKGACSQAVSNPNLVSSTFKIERFNALLRIIKSSLIDLEKGIKGLVVMSSDLEETFNCIFDAKVPPLWGKVRYLLQPNDYYSLDMTDLMSAGFSNRSFVDRGLIEGSL